jgi:outer membrane lipoprotein-sorting protein
MRTQDRRRWGIILLSLAFLGTASAITIEELTEKLSTRYAEGRADVEDFAIVQELEVSGVKSSQKVYTKGEKFRVEMTMGAGMEGMPEMRMVVIHNGEDTWILSPMGRQRISAEQEAQYRQEQDLSKLIPAGSRIAGEEKVDDRSAWVVEIPETDTASPYTQFWIDTERLVPLKAGLITPQGEMEIYFKDYHEPKAGWELPYRTETYLGGKPFSTTTVKEVRINQGLSDDLFNPEKVEGGK